MKQAYPVFIAEYKEDFLVYVPDMDIFTEGKNVADAIEMARDASAFCMRNSSQKVFAAPVECFRAANIKLHVSGILYQFQYGYVGFKKDSVIIYSYTCTIFAFIIRNCFI